MSSPAEKSIQKTTLKLAFESTFHNSYQFDDFLNLNLDNEIKCFYINERPVYKVSPKLKKYLRFLNTFIFNHADINENVVHSYRKEKNPRTAIEKHKNSKYFFKTDISNFFYSVSKKDIEILLKNNLDSSPIADIKNFLLEILNLVTVEDVLPVGFATSPSITNSILFDFDNFLESYCYDNNIVYTRYSDDLILSSENSQSFKNIKPIVTELLINHATPNFSINEKKTKFLHIGNKVKLLGMVVLPSGGISVDSTTKKEIEALLHFYTSDNTKFSALLNRRFDGKISNVAGKLNYINTIDKNFMDKLRVRYGNFAVDHLFSGMEG
ncbi:reverse transcriptase domain-containing protein [Vreelandella sp.]|uniref:reverse transcriptase domain-containing protein n=1 Tax=Vreelandella sp. TaxID=3137778 RepID=UPI003BAD294C